MSGAEAFVLFLQRALLALAPREFRARFGDELLACARRSLADGRRARGPAAGLATGFRHALDIGTNALLLRARTPTMKRTLLLLPCVLLASFGTAYVDLGQDEVQPAALLLLVTGALAAFLDARRAWLWWLLLGASIPLARLWLERQGPVVGEGPFVGTLLAFIPAGIGVLAGVGLHFVRRAATSADKPA